MAAIAQRQRLIMVTKGNPDEQLGKLERSGLRSLFEAVEVLTEKDADSYRDVIQRHDCDPAITWMIGNSPKSDINPALKAGLNTVFIPHDCTWVLEHEVVDAAPAGQRFIEVAKFCDLLDHF